MTETVLAERIDLSLAPAQVIRGQPFEFLIKLTDNATELVGYSLDVDIQMGSGLPSSGKVKGIVPPDWPASDFYLQENLIAQGGGMVGAYSFITDGNDDGVYVSVINQNYTNVMTAGEGHDVLAKVMFDVPSDVAVGSFTLTLGPATTLVTLDPGSGLEEIPFESDSVTIEVIPEPGGFGLLAGAYLLLRRRR
ncbi:MAG: hypothetical protein KAV82_11460 [Phycisphaerae bacterium]|nr:hypothetical protein [Phycisphaerae bacterium]